MDGVNFYFIAFPKRSNFTNALFDRKLYLFFRRAASSLTVTRQLIKTFNALIVVSSQMSPDSLCDVWESLADKWIARAFHYLGFWSTHFSRIFLTGLSGAASSIINKYRPLSVRVQHSLSLCLRTQSLSRWRVMHKSRKNALTEWERISAPDSYYARVFYDVRCVHRAAFVHNNLKHLNYVD
jgi:hypothetical protein